MRKYLLDTNIISYLDDPQSPYQKPIVNRLSSLGSDDFVLSNKTSFHLKVAMVTELSFS
ncbi:MAG: hypothetical protein L7F77_00765 [Candidatus Magnetominusculus sp. LBB02]|nr:hypothetical protein [Candidatus Magnetominusculus sp. LBB02]